MGCSVKLDGGTTCGKSPTKKFKLYLDIGRFNSDGTVNPKAKNLSIPVEVCADHENGWDKDAGLVVRRFGNDFGVVRR